MPDNYTRYIEQLTKELLEPPKLRLRTTLPERGMENIRDADKLRQLR